MASETERVDYLALIRAEHLRKEAGRQALRALVYDLGPNSTVEDAVYGLAQEVLALRERVAALERQPAQPTTRPAPVPADLRAHYSLADFRGGPLAGQTRWCATDQTGGAPALPIFPRLLDQVPGEAVRTPEGWYVLMALGGGREAYHWRPRKAAPAPEGDDARQ